MGHFLPSGISFRCWPQDLYWLLGSALLGALLVRLFYSAMAAFFQSAYDIIEPKESELPKWEAFLRMFGWGKRHSPDAFTGVLLGFVQLVLFPFLIQAQSWTLIAAWLAAQMAVGWRQWGDSPWKMKPGPVNDAKLAEMTQENRGQSKNLRIRFNLFLVATAMVLAMSTLLSAWLLEDISKRNDAIHTTYVSSDEQDILLIRDSVHIGMPGLEAAVDRLTGAVNEAADEQEPPFGRFGWPLLLLTLGLLALSFVLYLMMGRVRLAPTLMVGAIGSILLRELAVTLAPETNITINEGSTFKIEMDSLALRSRLGDVYTLRDFVVAEDTLARRGDTLDFLQSAGALLEHAGDDSLLAVLVIGQVDKRPLEGRAKKRFGGNESLATARARYVRDLLVNNTGDRASMEKKVVLLGAGAAHFGADLPQRTLADDRRVEVRGLWMSGRISATAKIDPEGTERNEMPDWLRWLKKITEWGALILAVLSIVIQLLTGGIALWNALIPYINLFRRTPLKPLPIPEAGKEKIDTKQIPPSTHDE